MHRDPRPGFSIRRGYYLPRCRTESVPRFRCRSCGVGFSRQTFRHDYRDRRPECNAPLLGHLASGVGLRQAGRLLKLDMHSVQGKMRKIARTCALLHSNLSTTLPSDCTYVLDEEETFEQASIRPLTMPVLIEKRTWFVVATAVGSIRRLARRGTRRRRRQDNEELRLGRRPDESRRCVRAVLETLARKAPGELVLRTDKKSSYRTLAKRIFGTRLVEHQTTSGKAPRTTRNPLFAINTTLAMTRDNCGRLRRRSWLVTKRREQLANQLAIFTVYRNYIRCRFNRDKADETPARLLGLLPRRMHFQEAVRWRQDWGELSCSPLSFLGERAIAA